MSWGEIYNTSWWGVALDTARTVKARPDFFGSQLNLLTSEHPNSVVNGDFATDLNNWETSSWWVWSALGAYHPPTNSHKPLYQETCVIGNEYLITFDLNVVQGAAKVSLGNNTGGTTQVFATGLGTGSYSYYVTASDKYLIFNRSNTSINNEYYLSNVSVQLVRAELDQIEAKKCLADWIHTTALKDLNN